MLYRSCIMRASRESLCAANNEIWEGKSRHNSSNKRAFKQIFLLHHLLKSNIDLHIHRVLSESQLDMPYRCSYACQVAMVDSECARKTSKNQTFALEIAFELFKLANET